MGKGKKIVSPVVFQGGVSKNIGVVEAFKKALGCDIIVDENGHLMGALGIAILAGKGNKKKIWYLRQERLTADAVRIIARSSVYTEMTC